MPAVSFHDVQFPTNISYGATGGPTFKTQITGMNAGFEQRNEDWDEALMRWNCAHNLWNKDRIDLILAFFYARAGRAYGFRFRDWSDYYAGYILNATDGSMVDDAASRPQIGTGNGTATVFQLTKSYTSGSVTRTRKITRPVTGSVKIFFGATLQASGYTVDYTTGKVTFTVAPPNGTVIRAAYQFDVPARFDTDQLEISMQRIEAGLAPNIPIVGLKE